MADNAHIYHPKNDSLAERIRAYRAVHRSYLNTEASLNFLDDDKWADTLAVGKKWKTPIKSASAAFNMATDAIRKEELSKAQEQGLLNKDEAREIIENQRQHKMQSIRQSKQATDESSYGQKQS